jgi:transposase
MTNENKRGRGRHAQFTAEFKAEAVRLTQTSGRPLRAIAEDLGVGLSTLGKWVSSAKEGSGHESAHIVRLART